MINTVKNMIKATLPRSTQYRILQLKGSVDSLSLFSYDRRRFVKHYLKSLRGANMAQLEGKLTFHAHSIEKGLSHDALRLGFGKPALFNLAEALKMYEKKGFDKTTKPYINAISTLNAYLSVHTKANYDTSYLRDLFGNLIDEAASSRSRIGGATTIKKSSKENNRTKNFEELFLGRYSVRSYDNSPLDIDKVEEAIALSMKAPSVCNRQSSRVRVITNDQIIKAALKIQGGFNGYDTPPALLVVTTDTSSFLNVTERNQVYVDGGLFSMSLLLGLEYQNIAACPLNTMFGIKQDKAIRKLLNIEQSENIIVFIAAGNFKDSNNVPKSFRLDPESVTKLIA